MKVLSKMLGMVAATALMAASANAALLTVSTQIGASSDLNSTTNTNTTGPFDTTVTNKSYRVDYFLQVAGLNLPSTTPPEVGFGNVQLDMTLGGGITRDSAGGRTNYIATNPLVDVFGDGSFTPTQWSTNGDKGVSTTDLKAILIDMGTGLASSAADPRDPRLDAGLNSPIKIGSVWVSVPSGAVGALATTLTPGSVTWSTSNGDPTTLVGTQYPASLTAAQPTFGGAVGTTPEPGSLALLGIAAIPAFRRRRA